MTINNKKSNILFLVIDSFRSDRCIGKNKSSITPNIDKLIKNGIYFDQAISSSDGTAFSMESIFSSLYPFKTKIENDVVFRLHSSPSYIKDLRDNGYNTYAIDLEMSKMAGLTRDFETNISIPNIESLYGELGDKILKHIDNLATPWFLYLHLQDLHSPFSAPTEFDEQKYGIDQYDRILSGVDSWFGKVLQKINLDETLIIITADHGEYVPTIIRNNEVLQVDSTSFVAAQTFIGQLIPEPLFPVKVKLRVIADKLRNKAKLQKIKDSKITPHEERSLTYIRANPDRSGYLFDDLVHIPLIFSGGHISTSKIIHQQVRHVDIFPTILEILDIPNSKKLIHGQSLLPLIENKSLPEEPAYIESTVTMRKGSGEVIGIRTSDFKYFKHTSNKKQKPMLFDLKNDPLEENNIYDDNPNVIKNFELLISELKKESSNPNSDSISKDEENKIEDELRKLGYI